jgi:DNA-binding transcriptional ArsR family regulator
MNYRSPNCRYLRVVDARFPLATAAALIADPARAAMLMALVDGRALAAGELARAANVSAQSASMHLSQLLNGGFVQVTQEGRHRYYRIASPEVAHAIEALGAISTPRKRKPIGEDDAIGYARTCYDHLAGQVAVRLAEGFERSGILLTGRGREYDVSSRGEQFLAGWQIDIAALRVMRRSFARRCLDWTERRDHIAGALGAAIYHKLIEFRWIARDPHSRVVRVTSAGSRHLSSFL